MEKENIVVSVCTLTYNQEKYIRKCLDGILAQECDFPFELIVHDDASTDSTPDIIREYASTYPQIKVILQQENQYEKGLVSIYNTAISLAEGEYIAFCEGDDYWVDPLKLQKQVDFLRNNDGYEMVHGKCHILYDDNTTSETHTSNKPYSGDIFHRLMENNFIYSPTPLFSKILAQEAIGTFLKESISNRWMTADLPLWLYIASKSKIGFINEVLAVYRVSNHSISNNKNLKKKQRFDESMLEIRRFMMDQNRVGGYFFNRIMTKYSSRLYMDAIRSDPQRARRHYYRNKFLSNRMSYLFKSHIYLCARFPFMERFTKKML